VGGRGPGREPRRFAGPATVSVHNAQVLARSQRVAAQLTEALAGRAVIDQALGVIMARTGANAQEAFDRLRAMSQAQHTKVVDVSRALLGKGIHRIH
jgi:AmiR/NasT family two-component response regulator